MGLWNDLFGGDKVSVSGCERTGVLGDSKDHIHADSIERHSDGNYTVTEHGGRRYEVGSDNVISVGRDVEYIAHERE